MDKIEDAIADFKEGKFVIVVDDDDRENEGDLIIAAEKITPEKVNFMLKHARGVLCAPITVSRCKELDLPHQVSDNTSVLGTPFTITIDKLDGCSTGLYHPGRAAADVTFPLAVLVLIPLLVHHMTAVGAEQHTGEQPHFVIAVRAFALLA